MPLLAFAWLLFTQRQLALWPLATWVSPVAQTCPCSGTCIGLVCILGCKRSWCGLQLSLCPPRYSAVACPHCLAGDRSDTDANICSSQDGDLADLFTTLRYTHTLQCQVLWTYMTNIYHHWWFTWLQTLRWEDNPNGCYVNTRGNLNRPRRPSCADVLNYRHICGGFNTL